MRRWAYETLTSLIRSGWLLALNSSKQVVIPCLTSAVSGGRRMHNAATALDDVTTEGGGIAAAASACACLTACSIGYE